MGKLHRSKSIGGRFLRGPQRWSAQICQGSHGIKQHVRRGCQIWRALPALPHFGSKPTAIGGALGVIHGYSHDDLIMVTNDISHELEYTPQNCGHILRPRLSSGTRAFRQQRSGDLSNQHGTDRAWGNWHTHKWTDVISTMARWPGITSIAKTRTQEIEAMRQCKKRMPLFLEANFDYVLEEDPLWKWSAALARKFRSFLWCYLLRWFA